MTSSVKLFEEGNKKSLKEFLISCGLTIEHIEKLKVEKNSSSYEYSAVYKPPLNKIKRLVPVERIIGISARGTVGESWYENLLNFHSHNFREESIWELSNNMKMSINDFQRSFELEHYSGGNLPYTYYKEEDVYISGNGGSHRTLFAKISGAKYILADVCECILDKHSLENFNRFKQKKNELNETIKGMHFELIDKWIEFKGIKIFYFNEVHAFDYSEREEIELKINELKEIENEVINLKDQYIKISWLPFKLQLLYINIKLNFSHNIYLEKIKKLLENGWKY